MAIGALKKKKKKTFEITFLRGLLTQAIAIW